MEKGRRSRPRMLTEAERVQLDEFTDLIHYSDRHVMLPKAMLKQIPKDYFDPETGTLKILHEEEWRGLGITQSLGWQHYEIHAPEPHILLFKRPKNFGQ
ncbi:regulatory subunit of cyclin-dependent kinase [Geopyxis carbonaria]|nr:regulatory subunit of cyclin-dependent kinase [Geopyxis carbonaria]